MKIKRGALFVSITIFFVIIFIVINGKYDPFYRVNGINSDNRALIEQYLDKEEQEYLITNPIPMDDFVEYIEVEDFVLEYYAFYNLINEAKIYPDVQTIVAKTNVLVERLSSSYSSDPMLNCQSLVHNNLIETFIVNESFDFDNISYYQQIRAIYPKDDQLYIEQTNEYVSLLKDMEVANIDDTLEVMCLSYSFDQLDMLMTANLESGVERVYNPSSIDVVVNAGNYIASYQPKNIVTTLDIPRVNYAMFLQKDAYDALYLMYHDMVAQVGEGLLLTKAYRSYDLTSLDADSEDVAGFNEFQLATSIEVHEIGSLASEFENSHLYTWLLENSYKYGYVLRYPHAKEQYTMENFDANTFRYVGEDLALELYTRNITLEEYLLAQ